MAPLEPVATILPRVINTIMRHIAAERVAHSTDAHDHPCLIDQGGTVTHREPTLDQLATMLAETPAKANAKEWT
jgi:hypothetical protein